MLDPDLPVVYVLGAGASMPYGLPSGVELRDDILLKLSVEPDVAVGDAHKWWWILGELGFNSSTVQAFTQELQRSHLNSIDSFLSVRSEFALIGKAAIALGLIGREHIPNLHVNHGDWYQYLWNRFFQSLPQGATAEEAVRAFAERYRFFTFNYDRTLEAFLVEAFSATFGLTDGASLQLVEPLFPVHFYGSLGRFVVSWDDTAGRPYDPRLDRGTVNVARSSIKVIPDERAPDLENPFDEFRDTAIRMGRVAFLGFGFDSINVSRLRIKELQQPGQGILCPRYLGTFYGLTTAETDRIVNPIGGFSSGTFDGQCLRFLRETWIK